MIHADPRYRPLSVEAVTLLQEGRVKEAIRVVREADELSQREARRRIDAHLATEPLLRAQLDARRHAARRRFFFWFVVVDAVITAAVIYWLVFREST